MKNLKKYEDYYEGVYDDDFDSQEMYDYENDESLTDADSEEYYSDIEDDCSEEEILKEDASQKKSFRDYDFIQIMQDYHSGDKAKREKASEQAIYALEGVGKSIIQKKYATYAPKHYFDLDQCAKLGIIKCLEKFDISKGIAPSTFAYPYMLHEMQSYIDTYVNKTTPHYSSNIRKIKKAISKLEIMTDKDITSIDIAQETGLTIEAVEQALSIIHRTDEVHIDNCTDAFINANIERVGLMTPEDELINSEKNLAIEEALSELTENERNIVLRAYGFEGKPESVKEISKALDIPVDKVKKMQADALRKLKNSRLKYLFFNFADREKNLVKSSFMLPLLNVGNEDDLKSEIDVLAEISDINF